MKLSEHMKPISYFKKHTAEIVKELEKNRNPLIVTQNGEAKMVVMDIRSYEKERELLAFLKIIALGQKEITAGHFQLAEDFFKVEESE